MAQLILFDVNETLLDTGALDPFFQRRLGSPEMRQRWFQELEIQWHVTIATGRYRDFATLAGAALQVTADKAGVELDPQAAEELKQELKSLPAHADAEPALTRLRDAGLRLAALTNGTLQAARAQLKHAELEGYFEQIMSADEVQRFKPAPEPYRMAAERLAVEPGAIRMVAAHAWDIAGAQAAGLATAFVARPGKVISPAGPAPDLRAPDLLQLAEAIVGVDG